MTSYPHRIRLRGPWESSIPSGADAVVGRIHLPCSLNETRLRDYAGPVRFTRSFGYPGRIDADERVWLIIAGLEREAEIVLNGRECGLHAAGFVELDATKLLSDRNRLEIVMAKLPDQKNLWEDVALEIRALAYLAQMHVERRGQTLTITGRVAGVAQAPLELYALVDGRNAAYQTVAAGSAFSIHIDEMPAQAKKLRVELVNVSTIWYAWESALPAVDGG
ncbi:MAG: hypothetical protein HY040_28465 [Planctomycetes bacterium]|nr:hypothetical protein [Planctomycetota bacterium]